MACTPNLGVKHCRGARDSEESSISKRESDTYQNGLGYISDTYPNPYPLVTVPPLLSAPKSQRFLRFAIAMPIADPRNRAVSETREAMLHCDLRVRWKVASDLRFQAAISEPKTPSFCGISGDLAQSTRKSPAIAIVRFWCAKPPCGYSKKAGFQWGMKVRDGMSEDPSQPYLVNKAQNG